MQVENLESSTKEFVFEFDIRRSVLLCAYMAAWGMPEYRVNLTKNLPATRIELYYFPSDSIKTPCRFTTVGLSACSLKSGKSTGVEWMMALSSDLGGASLDSVFNYFADLIAHHLKHAPNSDVPRVMTSSELAPPQWTAKAFLLDELRGEPESLEEFTLGSQQVALLWAVPITEGEAQIILAKGIEEFDAMSESSHYSLIDPARPST